MEKNTRNKMKKSNLLITAIPFIPIVKQFEKKMKMRNIDYKVLQAVSAQVC